MPAWLVGIALWVGASYAYGKVYDAAVGGNPEEKAFEELERRRRSNLSRHAMDERASVLRQQATEKSRGKTIRAEQAALSQARLYQSGAYEDAPVGGDVLRYVSSKMNVDPDVLRSQLSGG